MQNKVCVIDYGMGNLRSVQKKLLRVGAEVVVSSNPAEIVKSSKLVLPGVGHFENGVKHLKEKGIWDVLNQRVLIDKTPILGICLGMQLMCNSSEEGNVTGLKWFDADVVHFKIKDKLKYKVPHMGWNNALAVKSSPLLKNIPESAQFYFVHSFHVRCNVPDERLTETDYEYTFTSAFQKGNIMGVQFHPEKSHDWGEMMFENFLDI